MFPPDDYEDPRIGRRELERLDPDLRSATECAGLAAAEVFLSDRLAVWGERDYRIHGQRTERYARGLL